MASKAIFKGSRCKTKCGGHRAGWNYAKEGGTQLSSRSTSFNNGMRIYLKQLPRRRR
ncbi:hypothetical protein UFOVP641_4 [uncultured Caudovirales phage]|uniref:Uncharacterized protein n=1 Tax=uncultured Caudovirales phage TaxID=2100421 RepID=A0A6J5N368_9CAUD|nr:hypothetical protein UFOVP641_4 [uncultured Caudovirales phage]